MMIHDDTPQLPVSLADHIRKTTFFFIRTSLSSTKQLNQKRMRPFMVTDKFIVQHSNITSMQSQV